MVKLAESAFMNSNLSLTKAVAYEKFQGAHKAKKLQNCRSPTCKVLGAAAKYLGAQSIFLEVPGYGAPVRQQPC